MNINTNINENNFLMFKKTNKILLNEIIPFINDFMKLAIFETKNKIIENEYDLPTFDGDNKIFTSYVKSILNSFKNQYKLNSDIYNFKSEFFEEKKIKNNIPKNVVIKNIEIYRYYNKFYIDFSFNIRFIINKELIETPLKFICNYGEISENNGFVIKQDFLTKLFEKYNIENYVKSVKSYQNILEYQNKIIKEYDKLLMEFNDNCINGNDLSLFKI